MVARLDDGEEILETLEKIVTENKIKVGLVQSIVGGVRNLKFSHFKEQGSNISEIGGPVNFLGSGMFMPTDDGKPTFHIHFSAGLFGKEARSCHLISGICNFYCDVVISVFEDIKAVKKQYEALPNIKHAKITHFL